MTALVSALRLVRRVFLTACSRFTSVEPTRSMLPKSHRADRSDVAAHDKRDPWCSCSACCQERRRSVHSESERLLALFSAMGAENDVEAVDMTDYADLLSDEALDQTRVSKHSSGLLGKVAV